MEMELLLLLTICLLMFSGKTFGNETGHVKITIKEDEDVILPCSLKTLHEDDKSNFDWKMDDKDVLLYESGTVNPSTQHDQFRGRVSHFRNGAISENASIKIIKAKVSDSGQYTCIDINQSPPENLNQVVLTVGAYAKPSVRTVNETHDWALLMCKVLDASPKPTVVWYDSAGNKVSDKEPQVIQKQNHYDVILETTVTKTDHYTCVATQEELHHQANETTYQHFGGVIITVSIVDHTDDWALLRCIVRSGLPKTTVVWHNSAGNKVSVKEPDIIEKGGSYNLILETKVTKTDRYSCIATQENSNHQDIETTFVYVRGKGISVTPSLVLIGITLGVLTGV
ncbi:protein turtle isoform X2 [Fundulus heteroclitus]|uniref:protein turtle isoform X2 n=1 Tax=Fundulus heteroclitus TaxID=8078 RepID=UPI00165B6A44|nr:protein turtle isoform X2 [Fundulus heteroclitus]